MSALNEKPIDYYEEIGVSATADAEEIKRALRRLARMVHPDFQHDAASRKIAEAQTRRFNQIRTVLLDPEKRHQYNLTLQPGYFVQTDPGPSLPRLAQRENSYSLILATVVLAAPMAILFWHTVALSPTPKSTARKLPTMVTLTPARQSKAVRKQYVFRQTVRQVPSPEIAIEPVPSVIASEGSLVLPDLQTEFSTTMPNLPDSSNYLNSVWVLGSGDQTTSSPRSYPAEYVQLRLRKARTQVTGRFEARYRVANLAISPSVRFDFAGPKAVTTGYRWNSADGSTGLISLKFTDRDHVVVTWTAEVLGSQMGLITGSSYLVRYPTNDTLEADPTSQ